MNDLDKTLYNISEMMKILVLGEDSNINLLCDRFLELNGIVIESDAAKKTFVNDVYNIAYATQILLRLVPKIEFRVNVLILLEFRNIQDVKLTVNGSQLPIDGAELLVLLRKHEATINKKKLAVVAKPSEPKRKSTDSIDEEDSASEDETDNATKNKKKKRRRGRGLVVNV